MPPIKLSQRVGRNQRNMLGDVTQVIAALSLIKARRGEFDIILPQDLVSAIKEFQFTEFLEDDGIIATKGNTLARINALLATDTPLPKSRQRPQQTGFIQRIDPPDGAPTTFATAIQGIGPLPQSLVRDFTFDFEPTIGTGRIEYFELDEDVVPNWFGVVIPDSVTEFNSAHIFFHPNPGRAGFNDATYKSKAGWARLFHYMSDDFSRQFCAAGLNQILIMPVFTAGTLSTAGVFPERWQSIVREILNILDPNPFAVALEAKVLRNIVLSSFSAGISYSHNFRRRANLDGVVGVIDFDGSFSSFASFSTALSASSGFRVVKFSQTPVRESQLETLALRNVFPIPPLRVAKRYGKNITPGQMHGLMPQICMKFAARRALGIP